MGSQPLQTDDDQQTTALLKESLAGLLSGPGAGPTPGSAKSGGIKFKEAVQFEVDDNDDADADANDGHDHSRGQEYSIEEDQDDN